MGTDQVFNHDHSSETEGGDSLRPEQINNVSKPFHLLRQAGYDEGDFIPLVSATGRVTASTSSDTYVNFGLENLQVNLRADIFSDPSTETAVYFAARVDPNGDQIDLRLRNTADGEILLEQTGTTGSSASSITAGPVSYTPTSSNVVVLIRPEHRNSDNTTSVTTRSMTWGWGIQL